MENQLQPTFIRYPKLSSPVVAAAASLGGQHDPKLSKAGEMDICTLPLSGMALSLIHLQIMMRKTQMEWQHYNLLQKIYI